MAFILAIVFAFLLLVTVHEFGHYIVARKLGVKVLKFSVGFGPSLFKWQSKDGTDFVLGAFPLGGYISMLDTRNQNDVAPEMESMAFDKVAPWRQILIAAAGPGANFVLAIVLFWFLLLGGVEVPTPYVGKIQADSPAFHAGMQPGERILKVDGEPVEQWSDALNPMLRRIGDSGSIIITTQANQITRDYSLTVNNWLSAQKDPNPLLELGFSIGMLPVIESVQPGSAAEVAGMQAGDHIIAIGGQPIRIWEELVEIVGSAPGQELSIQFRRDGNPFLVTATPASTVASNGAVVGRLGIVRGHPTTNVKRGLFGSVVGAFEQTWNYATLLITSIAKMITGQMSVANLAGPVSIAQIAGTSAQSNILDYVSLLGMLSVSLGLINLLPIPVLDGGHIVYATVQWITRKPIPLRTQQIATMVGIFFIGGLFILVLFNDITRFFPS